MENLLNPDFGVMALTIVNFLLLVWLLHKFAWKSIIGALEKREQQIAQDKETAALARQEAQNIKAELDAKLKEISNEAALKMQEAVAVGNAQKEQILAETQKQAEQLLAQAKEQIAAEKTKALADVREQVVSMALLAAVKITQQQITQETAASAVDEVLREVKQAGVKTH
ncbi:MAG: F0F1 ATP synthase subunit B [Elusimicrobiaceae bacterium]|nr:F0F1 ATP synthase subunit B [Elusimicrobiaceae bacterium]